MQKASRAFYDVHNLLIRRKSPKALEQFFNSKNMIKSEFETAHRLLQSSYRHIIDFTSSCKRAPNERAVSAQRCQRSGRAILRDIQAVTRAFDAMVESFKVQRATLSAISAVNQNTKNGTYISRQSLLCYDLTFALRSFHARRRFSVHLSPSRR